MEYRIAVAPELQISPAEFTAAWNDAPECRQMAQAELLEASPKGFALDPELFKTGLTLLAGFAGSIAVDVVKDLIKERLKKLLEKKFAQKSPVPEIEVLVIAQPGAPLIVVKAQEK